MSPTTSLNHHSDNGSSTTRPIIGECSICQHLSSPTTADLQLHKAVYQNDISAIQSIISCPYQHQLSVQDSNGNTALHIAVMLSNINATTLLLDAGANVKLKNTIGSTCLTEAISVGNRQVLAYIYEQHAVVGHSDMLQRTKQILDQLSQIPNFTLVIDWKFSSWLPFINRMLPNDRLRIYKFNNTIKIDTTLIDINDNLAQGLYKRGNVSYLLKVRSEESLNNFNVYALDNINKWYQRLDSDPALPMSTLRRQSTAGSTLQPVSSASNITSLQRSNSTSTTGSTTQLFANPEEFEFALDDLVSMPIVNMRSVGKTTFELQHAGIWPFRHAKRTTIGGYECQVHHVTGVNWRVKKRVEHLTKQDLAQQAAMSSMLRQGLSGTKKQLRDTSNRNDEQQSSDNGSTVEEHDLSVDASSSDVGLDFSKFQSANTYEGDAALHQPELSAAGLPTPSVSAVSPSAAPFSRMRATADPQYKYNNKHLPSQTNLSQYPANSPTRNTANKRRPQAKHRPSLPPPDRHITFEQYFANNHVQSSSDTTGTQSISRSGFHTRSASSSHTYDVSTSGRTPTNASLSASQQPLNHSRSTRTSGHHHVLNDDVSYMHLGRAIQLQEDSKKYSASVHMTQNFPLSIDTVSSILEVIAPHQQHIAKLHKFIKKKLPDGFPVQVELPIVPTVKAVVTFVDYTPDTGKMSELDFIVPKHYTQHDFHPLTVDNRPNRES